jgi:hypothetical protein
LNPFVTERASAGFRISGLLPLLLTPGQQR